MDNDEFDNGQRAFAQAEAVRVLGALADMQINRRLPLATWVITPYSANLNGQVTAFQRDDNRDYVPDDKQSFKNVDAWARTFGIKPEYRKWLTQPDLAETFATVTECGVTITVWACVHAPTR